MNTTEYLLRILAALKPMLPSLIAAGVATLCMFLLLAILGRNVWVQDQRFKLMGLFFGLDWKGSLRLACAWLKLIFLVIFVVGFQKLILLHYLMLLLPGVLLALGELGIQKKMIKLLWLVLQTMGLLSDNLICGYFRDMSGGLGFLVIYITMGLFLILFSIYLFLNDLADISLDRDVDAHKVWGDEVRNIGSEREKLR